MPEYQDPDMQKAYEEALIIYGRPGVGSTTPAKRKPFPCRLGVHWYRRTYDRYECVCGETRNG